MELDVFSLCLGGSCASAPPPSLSRPCPPPPKKALQVTAPPPEMIIIMPTGYLRPSPKTRRGDFSPIFFPQNHPGVAVLFLLNLVLLNWFDLDDCVGGEA